MVSGSLIICGRDARKKALAVAMAIIQRCRNIFKKLGLSDFTNLNIEVCIVCPCLEVLTFEALGHENTYGEQSRTKESREVMLRITATHSVPVHAISSLVLDSNLTRIRKRWLF